PVPDISYVNRYGQRYSRIVRHIVGMRSVPDSAFANSPWTSAKVFAFRQKANLFGHNAPNPHLFVNSAGAPANTLINADFTWASYQIRSPTQIDLDATYPKVVPGSWFAMVTSDGAAQLYKVASAQSVSRSDFALSGKV